MEHTPHKLAEFCPKEIDIILTTLERPTPDSIFGDVLDLDSRKAAELSALLTSIWDNAVKKKKTPWRADVAITLKI